MSTAFDETSTTRCGCCKRGIVRAHAKVGGQLYCHSCYMRELDSEPCSKCRKLTRLQTDSGVVLCRSCRAADRSCIRCKKPVPRAALTTKDGVACPSCAVYYKEPRPCAVCGQQKLRLSRDFKQGFMEPVCQSCRRIGFISCACCGKDRRPAGVNAANKPICKPCVALGGQPFVCPKCKKEGRRYSSTRCEECYWSDSANKRAQLAAANLTHLWSREAFVGFFAELRKRIPAKIAALRIERYFLFFAKLDTAIPDSRKVDAEALAGMFGADGLRRNAVPYGYLVKSGIVKASTDEQIQAGVERRMQQALLERSRGKWFEDLLMRFHRYLEKIHERYVSRGWTGKRARFIPRSVTAALRAATTLLESLPNEMVVSTQQLEQSHFDRFLVEHSGYRHSLRSFVRYLNRKEKMFRPLRYAKEQRAFPAGLLLERPKYEELVGIWLQPDDKHLKESLVCSLMLLYAQQVSRVVRLQLSQIAHSRNGTYRIMFGQTEIVLDQRIAALLDRYLPARRALATMDDAWNNDFLFTGRRYGSHLTEAAVTLYLRRHHVRAEQLYATAIFRAYLSGLRHPKVLVKAFGISDATAIHYIEVIDPRLRDEVERQVVNA